ncbi:MAG: type II secretion system protein [Elusimicrobia bacterium]|nr:type II secretion system protein [Elusimicrobiota bacterium]
MVIRARRGFTLVELLVVSAVVGSLLVASVGAFRTMWLGFRLNLTRLELSRDGRTAMRAMGDFVRNGRATSIRITTPAGQPLYSSIEFTNGSGQAVAFFQRDRRLVMSVNGNTRDLTSDLHHVCFVFPDLLDLTHVSINLTLERQIVPGWTKAVALKQERIEILEY